MTEQEKELLLKDLCARLPYGIMCRIDHDPEGEYDIEIDDERFVDDRIVSVCPEPEQIFVYEDEDYPYSPDEIRPYLRPLTSMTKEEKRELSKKYFWCINCGQIEIRYHSDGYWDDNTECPTSEYLNLFDWLNARHFDYRGLIEKGLALEAPEEMYQTET